MTNGSYKHHIIWEKEVWSKLPLVLICCYSLYHSLSLVVPLVVTHCHLPLSLIAQIAVTCHSMYHSFVFLTKIRAIKLENMAKICPIRSCFTDLFSELELW